MSAERHARRLLRLDGVYCVAAGVIALVLAVPLARVFHVQAELIAGLGAATIVWGVLLTHLASRADWHRPLAVVAAANAAASTGLAVVAILAPGALAHLLLAAVAVEVAAFSAVQVRILRRPASDQYSTRSR